MKIGQPSELPSLVSQSNASASQKANSAASANAPAAKGSRSAGVAVTVSTLARGMEKADASQEAEIDAQKVASVRSAIQQGTYVVNPEAIADKLLSNAQEMLKRTAS